VTCWNVFPKLEAQSLSLFSETLQSRCSSFWVELWKCHFTWNREFIGCPKFVMCRMSESTDTTILRSIVVSVDSDILHITIFGHPMNTHHFRWNQSQIARISKLVSFLRNKRDVTKEMFELLWRVLKLQMESEVTSDGIWCDFRWNTSITNRSNLTARLFSPKQRDVTKEMFTLQRTATHCNLLRSIVVSVL